MLASSASSSDSGAMSVVVACEMVSSVMVTMLSAVTVSTTFVISVSTVDAFCCTCGFFTSACTSLTALSMNWCIMRLSCFDVLLLRKS